MPTLTNQYAQLGTPFGRPALPSAAIEPALLLWNQALADELGIDADATTLAQWFSGQTLMPGSEPFAMAYAGHQFGQFNPQLGDGRAHLLGEIHDAEGQSHDLHLKGSGPTPFSRGGDGYCALGPAVREFIMAEAMHALGVPTTRALSVVLTDREVIRQTAQPGAVVSRVADSHIRFGSFEFFAARRMLKELNQLFEHALGVHFPDIDLNDPERFVLFLENVKAKQIELVTHWLRVGFIHGVMNTDNCLVSGQTIDYGPCALMGVYDPATVFSSIDHQGRYAFGQQAHMVHWNLARLAESILPLIDADMEQAIPAVMPVIESYPEQFNAAFDTMMSAKLGLPSDQLQLIKPCLEIMERQRLDYTLTFIHLQNSFQNGESSAWCKKHFGDWYDQWLDASKIDNLDAMQAHNPLVIPRNHHMEHIIQETIETRSNQAALKYLDVLRAPYAMTDHTTEYQEPNPEADLTHQTFCGT